MREWIGCAIWLVFAIAVLTASADLQVMTRFGPGPGFFLRVLGIVLLGLSLVQALTLVLARRRGAPGSASPQQAPETLVAILEADEEDKPMAVDRRSLIRFGLLALTLFAYGLLLEPLGFLSSTTALAWASMALLGRPVLRSLIESIAAIVIAYLLFGHVLDVNLPAAHLAPLKALGL